jgi:hypothetical protein
MSDTNSETIAAAAGGDRKDASQQSGSSPPKVIGAAEELIAAGLAVLPLKPKDKGPLGNLVRNGVLNATTDVVLAKSWFAKSPDANIAAAPPTGTLVLDLDPNNGGTKSLVDLIRKNERLPKTVTVRTPGKVEKGKRRVAGHHYYFTCPETW